jgi:hypothetical protein
MVGGEGQQVAVSGSHGVRLRPLLLLAALVSVGLVVGWIVDRHASPAEPAPFATGNSTLAGATINVGSIATWGAIELINRRHEPVRIDGIELLRRTPGLHVITIFAAGPRRGMNLGGGRGPAPAALRDREPLAGAIVPAAGSPGADWGVEVVVEAAATQQGIIGFHAIAIRWSSAGKHGRTVLPDGLALCVPASAYKDCSPDWLGR